MKTMMTAVVLAVATAAAGVGRLDWEGRNVVFLGDSVTDKRHCGCETNYWGFLAERMGFKAYVYGISGQQFRHIPAQVEKAKKDLGDNADAVFVFMGTNDYNGNVPRGEWFESGEEKVNRNGREVVVKKRELVYDNTYRGRINTALRTVKRAFPRQQVILLTPLHRGFATFGAKNVQPDERYANELGLFISDYAEDVRTAGQIWSIPVIDLYGESGILPMEKEYGEYMAKPGTTDMLHPSSEGHNRLALMLEAKLRAMAPTFRK